MNEGNRDSFFENMCKIGTPQCAIFFAVIAMILGLLLLWVGFWKTVLLALLMAVGAFLGGVKDKRQWLKNAANRVIPDHQTVPYREAHPDIVRAVREATKKKDELPQEEEEDEEE